MTVKLIQTGNFKGIRISKEFLQGFSEETRFRLEQNGDKLILSQDASIKENWIEQIKNELVEKDETFALTKFDENEWEWK